MDQEDPGIALRERERDNIYIAVHVLTLLIGRENIVGCLLVLGVFILLSGIAQEPR